MSRRYKDITFVGSGTEAHDAGGGGGDVTVPVVGGLQKDDFKFVTVHAADNVVCSINGWTRKQEPTQTATLKQTLFWKRHVFGDPAPVLVLHTAGNAVTARMHALRGVSPTAADPIEAIGSTGTSASLVVTAPDITTLTDKAAVCFIGSIERTANTSDSPLFGAVTGATPTLTEKTDDANGLNTNMISGSVSFGVSTTAGAVGSRTSTVTGMVSPTANIGTLFAVTPEEILFPYDRYDLLMRKINLRSMEAILPANLMAYFNGTTALTPPPASFPRPPLIVLQAINRTNL